MAKQRLENLLGKICQGDCVGGMKKLPDESVQLAFADPPFNIGYDYDEYDDRLEAEKYLEWSRQWMQEVYRVLDPRGTFWLAIGDEYAAELKVEAQKIGFHPRNWVIWYYTFGVHCKTKFTRSHAHLFYFVKDPKEFTFNSSAVAVPSARQLVYGDSRANPNGRMPDDTWILRPQDCIDGFTPDEDTWYFPRVAGTFKERAGFHGCQMPEQLLGRIIRSCCNVSDIVLDPFAGSATTLVAAKKEDRRFVGFELSRDYARQGRQRLRNIRVGDALEGSEEPKVSAPATDSPKARRLKSDSVVDSGFRNLTLDFEEIRSESEGIVEAFSRSNRGYSVDRVVADPLLNEDFQLQCDRCSVPGTHAERNRFLFRLRKSGKLKRAGIETAKRTKIDWESMEAYLFAAEIAWRQVSELYAQLSLDEIICDPRHAAYFDEIARRFSPGYTSLEYRWSALKLRKEGSNGRKRAGQSNDRALGISGFKNTSATCLSKFDFRRIDHEPGVYALRNAAGDYLYAGETEDLGSRLLAQFCEESQAGWNINGDRRLFELVILPVASVCDARFARQSRLLKRYRPEWNHNDQLAA